jgi:hypothetical protein
MAQLNHVYQNIIHQQKQDMVVDPDIIEVGELLVGKVITKVNGENMTIFLRVQIVQIELWRDAIMAVDIDDQTMKLFNKSDLYWMIDHFHHIPMRVRNL